MAGVIAQRARYLELRGRQRVERVIPDRGDPLAFDEETLFRRYRFRRPTLLFLFDLLAPVVARPTLRNGALPVHVVVLTALSFFATSSFYHVVAVPLKMTRAAAGVCVHEVAAALADMTDRFIGWADIPRTKAELKNISG